MARPKGSRNKQKTPEQIAAADERKKQRAAKSGASVNGKHPPGENASALTDDQARALHFLHVKEYEQANDAVKKAQASRKTVIGRIKSEGGVLSQIKTTIGLRDPEREQEIRDDIIRTVTAAKWADSPIGNLYYQLDLFQHEDRSPVLEKAYSEGKTAGLRGDNPTTEFAGDAEQEWLRGWHDGQDALRATMELFRSPKREVEEDEAAYAPAGQMVAGEEGAEAADGDSGAESEAPGWLRDESEDLPSNENLADPSDSWPEELVPEAESP